MWFDSQRGQYFFTSLSYLYWLWVHPASHLMGIVDHKSEGKAAWAWSLQLTSSLVLRFRMRAAISLPPPSRIHGVVCESLEHRHLVQTRSRCLVFHPETVGLCSRTVIGRSILTNFVITTCRFTLPSSWFTLCWRALWRVNKQQRAMWSISSPSFQPRIESHVIFSDGELHDVPKVANYERSRDPKSVTGYVALIMNFPPTLNKWKRS